ncbi:hypothetical protein CPB86DRAFT_308657 [Serendipita vermifera]|nr:hypothetical protein CPB86DRAFT_308657 [Serendipita vermifera]
MAENGISLSQDGMYTEIQRLFKVRADDFSPEELSHIYNGMNAVFTRKRIQMASRPSKALQVLAPCTPEITSHLPFLDSIHLFQVCRTARLWKRNVISSMVFHLLRRYVSDPGKLRDLMKHVGAVISGSSVLWLIDSKSNSWEPKDLDVYAPAEMARTVIDFFLQEGYELIPRPETELEGNYIEVGHLNAINKLFKGDRKVEVMESLTESSIRPVLAFHSTAVMNYITADSIVMLYPRLTFSRLTVRNNAAVLDEGWASKYHSRMYHVSSIARVYSFQRELCRNLARKTGDRFCLCHLFVDMEDGSRQDATFAEWHFRPSNHYNPHKDCTPERCYVVNPSQSHC